MAEPTAAGLDRISVAVTRDTTAQVSRGLSGGRPPVSEFATAGGPARHDRSSRRPQKPAYQPVTRPARSTPAPKVAGTRFLTADLNVWTGPGERFKLVTVLSARSKVAVTNTTKGGWAQIVFRDKPRWVNAAYLAKHKPAAEKPPASGISDAPCASGSAVETGLTPNAILVHRSVCALFPEVTTYGGLRSDGEHGQGRALDIMVSSDSLGDAIAAWARANSDALGVSEVIWAQHIWTVQRSSEGWRLLEDRGSVTANHYDHVHVTVYG